MLCRPGESRGICCGQHLSDPEIFTTVFDLDECGPSYVIPDYLSDLNAMHDAEQTLNSAQRHRFNVIVACLHSDIPLAKIPIDYDFKRIGFKAALAAIDATASERAEAFLRTLGKWTDEAANPV